MPILKIVSEHKKIKVKPLSDCRKKDNYLKHGFKRIEAIIEINGKKFTRHIDIKK
jgi:hypothetical protein